MTLGQLIDWAKANDLGPDTLVLVVCATGEPVDVKAAAPITATRMNLVSNAVYNVTAACLELACGPEIQGDIHKVIKP